MKSTNNLTTHLVLLGAILRRWPRSMRKLDWWWERMYRAIGAGGFEADPAVDAHWPSGLQHPVSGRLHPFKVRLNVNDWLERRAYFSGQLYQRDIEKLITLLIRPDDYFIDVGANIGLVSLLAASRLGKSGCLVAIEPNPTVFKRLTGHLRDNGLLPTVTLLNIALGERSATAFLHVAEGHTGTGTLTHGDAGIPVKVETAGEVIPAPADDQPVVIKMDVEGFECRALAGMSELLARVEVAVLIEISRDMLERIGDSSAALHDKLVNAGFDCYLIHFSADRWHENFFLQHTLVVLDEPQYDALYVKHGSKLERRVSEFMR